MMKHLYLKYPPPCEVCGKTPPAKVGIWHHNEGDTGIYICNECHDKEQTNGDNTDIVEA